MGDGPTAGDAGPSGERPGKAKGPRKYELHGPFWLIDGDTSIDRLSALIPAALSPAAAPSRLGVWIGTSCRSRSPRGARVRDFYALGTGPRKEFRQLFRRIHAIHMVVHSICLDVHRGGAAVHSCGRPPVDDQRAASKAAAISSNRRSAPNGATSWIPTGSPSGVVPAGTESAGQPVTVMK